MIRRPPRSTPFLHDALPILVAVAVVSNQEGFGRPAGGLAAVILRNSDLVGQVRRHRVDRKSTRLNSSHTVISYAVFCLKKKKKKQRCKQVSTVKREK